ncbi:hypothetical protein MSAN_02029600 [Mycena sanguinolenta]|uniref:Uncharacterized protein n=1 Tax=Mycena sanguinolenta TaxID=230812 RepID=A0A8H7CNS6_9AGAR|nr:hypothetical protein MSAN_02029600 [Mycena sanguinolenta]
MDSVEPRITVDLSQAIKITNVHLNAILAQHAQQLAELDGEDPPAAPLHAHSVVFWADGISESHFWGIPIYLGLWLKPLPPVDSMPEGLKQGGEADPASHAASHRPEKKKRPRKHKSNRQEKRAQIQAADKHAVKACALRWVCDPDYDKAPSAQHIESLRRGPHYAVHMCNGMGGGQQRPTPFALHASVLQILTSLFIHHAIARFVGLANALFQLYAPKLHNYYLHTMEALSKWDPDLPLLAPPLFLRTVTLPHLDFLNLSWGWCFITALGWYDYRRGGHLILWDLRLIIEFPPGATFDPLCYPTPLQCFHPAG